MSLDLVRQALAFVDQEGSDNSSKTKRNKRGAASTRQQHTLGQDPRPYKHKNKKQKKKQEVTKSKEEVATENIQKLLALSKPTTNTKIAEKIIKRAVSRKPLTDKIEVKKQVEKSILFPDDEPNDNSSVN